jgi:hypothetical protein
MTHLSFQISAPNAASFLNHWSSKYNYPVEGKYTNNIGKPLTKKSLQELFEWKNGTGSKIAAPKATSLAANYPIQFDGDKRGRYLNHRQPGGAIWNIFFLHCLEPEVWPIFDQHTFRAMRFVETGRVEEIGYTNKQKYEAYQTQYIPFLATFKAMAETTDQRAVDKALFTFGQFLKIAARYA